MPAPPWTALFESARGSLLFDAHGREYVDFASGGARPYGHQPPALRRALLEHAWGVGIPVERAFRERFDEIVLQPRGLRYHVSFPSSSHATEAALRLARGATARLGVIGFTDGAHGSLVLTSRRQERMAARTASGELQVVPFDGFFGPDVDTIELIEQMLEDPSSGLQPPAAFLLETVQARSARAASAAWLRRLEVLARDLGSLLVVDEAAAGCGRTGSFFSFDESGIAPDVVCLSESLSGYGLPLSVVLVRPELWGAGELGAAPPGAVPALVTAAASLEIWDTPALGAKVSRDGEHVAGFLRSLGAGEVRGRGLLQGLVLRHGLAREVAAETWRRGLVLETMGPEDEVLLLLPSLLIERELLDRGLQILADSCSALSA